MKKRSRKIWRRGLLIMGLVMAVSLIWAYVEYGSYLKIPKERLDLAGHYSDMPPDDKHIYIELPLDHRDPGMGRYKGFYILSPGFTPRKDVIFYMTDGQQNKVYPGSDLRAFERKLPGLSYVAMGRRGSYPVLFPEIYTKKGKLDYPKAVNLYGTAQQIEDIELVRQDLEQKGYLPPDGKIMLYGTSGGGILIQQYLARYGEHVSRVLLEATGAPDIVIDNQVVDIGSPFTEMMKSKHPETFRKLEDILAKKKVDPADLSFMLFKIQLYDLDWEQTATKLIDGLAKGKKLAYYKKRLSPEYNLSFTKWMFKLPMSESTKVRIFEIVGEQMMRNSDALGELNIPFVWEKEMIGGYIQQAQAGVIDVPKIHLAEKRKTFQGEVWILSADEDNQFSVRTAEQISQAYPNAKMTVVHDTHAMLHQEELYRKWRAAFFTKGLGAEELEFTSR